MYKFDVSLEIKSEIDDAFCRFSISEIPFLALPASGDLIAFDPEVWPEKELAHVQCLYHGVTNTPICIVCCTIPCKDREHVLAVFDKFKDTYKLIDLVTDEENPPAHYSAFRFLVRLFGKKEFEPGIDNPTVLAEIIRHALDTKAQKSHIEKIHRLIIEHKKKFKDEPIPLLWIMKEFDKENSLAEVIASADEEEIRQKALGSLSGLKSVMPEQIPGSLKDEPWQFKVHSKHDDPVAEEV